MLISSIIINFNNRSTLKPDILNLQYDVPLNLKKISAPKRWRKAYRFITLLTHLCFRRTVALSCHTCSEFGKKYFWTDVNKMPDCLTVGLLYLSHTAVGSFIATISNPPPPPLQLWWMRPLGRVTYTAALISRLLTSAPIISASGFLFQPQSSLCGFSASLSLFARILRPPKLRRIFYHPLGFLEIHWEPRYNITRFSVNLNLLF
jgi:hypothetical protein